MDDEGEVHGGGMDTPVDETLGHIQRRDAGLLLELLQPQHELMHTDAVKGGLEGALNAPHEIVGVEDGVLRRLRDALPAQRQQIGQRLHHHQEVAVEGTHLQVLPLRQNGGLRQIRLQKRLAAHGACTGPAAAVGGGKGLVQVHVDAVKAHIAGAHNAHNGVEVGSVVVAQAPGLVDQPGDLQNVLVENAHGVGIGQHQPRHIVSQHRLQSLQIHAAVGGGGDVHHLIAAHSGGGGIGAVGAVGNDDLGALMIAPCIVVLLDQQHAGELAVSAGGGLEGHAVHAGDLAEIAAGGIQHLPASGHGVLRGQGMHPGKARQGRHLLVDAGVILHGAGAQRIKAAVDAVNVLAQLRVVAAQIHLAELRQGRGLLPPQLLRQLHLLHDISTFIPPCAIPFSKISFICSAPPSPRRRSHPARHGIPSPWRTTGCRPLPAGRPEYRAAPAPPEPPAPGEAP